MCLLFSNNMDRKTMIEMDRFVMELSGSPTQTLVRQSEDSLATMKEGGGTLSK